MKALILLAASVVVASALSSGCTNSSRALVPPYTRYTNTTNYLRWDMPPHSDRFVLKGSECISTGAYPSFENYDGVGPFWIDDATATLDLDASTNTGTATMSVNACLSPSKNGTQCGEWTIIVSTFQGYPGFPMTPLQQGGIASGIVMHGCTKQGETYFPQMNCSLSTWGTAEVLFEDELVYENLYSHLMWGSRSRDNSTLAIYANKEQTAFYDPTNCNDGYASPTETELHFIAAQPCYDPTNWPPYSALFQFVFHNVVDLSPPPS